MRIAIDAMGGDNAPAEIVKGVVEAAKETDASLILVGKGEEILRVIEAMGLSQLPSGIEIANASEIITMEDPATAVRTKSDSSMSVCLRMLHLDEADAAVSAGNTGALLSGATLIVKRIHGIRRAALAPMLPNGASGVMLIDCGANAECTSEYLVQFAYMGSLYMKSMAGIERPRIGLLNNGTEETKGTALQRETYALLKEAKDLNFVGNIEARDVFFNTCDVIVCDGFSGNIFLKSIEGMGKYMGMSIKSMFMKNPATKVAGLMVRKGMSSVKKEFDPSEVGGTALLGISKPVIKAHGSSDARAIKNAIFQAIRVMDLGVVDAIKNSIESMNTQNEGDKKEPVC